MALCENDRKKLLDKANTLPLCPGVYIMRDRGGNVIYVGKSRKLKSRVSQYFQKSEKNIKTARMVSQVQDFDYYLCDTEIEALSLENTLIKQYTPKYNIRLKDAKSYPYIKLTREEYPTLTVTRDRRSDKSKYFGPYRSASDAYSALDTVKRIFGLATCKRSFPRDIGRERPCIYKDIGRCSAPCDLTVSGEEYRQRVRGAASVLDGNIAEVKRELEREMTLSAEALEFERAAALRDQIRALSNLSESQKVVADPKVSRDVFALYTSEVVGVLAMLSIREGALVNKNEFILSGGELTGEEDALTLIVDYYDTAGNIPREIMLDFSLDEEDRELLGEYLSLDAGRRVAIKIPERGEGRRLCDMAEENAKEAARQATLEVQRDNKSLHRLGELLGIDVELNRIEAYDISNYGNESIFASMVVMLGGKMRPSHYRAFSIKTTSGADDYGSMKEALTRRALHIGDGTQSLGERPDLILLDGGVGQVSVVKAAFRELNIDIPVFGMVKDDYHKTRAIVDTDREISIAREMQVYTLIYNMQEEAHRFARKHSSGGKSRSLTGSSLTKIDGIGPAKAKRLLAAMPLSRIKTATVEELVTIKGISRLDAENIVAYYEKKRKG